MVDGPNYIALAVPFFFLLIGIELVVAWRRRERPYQFADTISDLGCGITQRVTLIFFEGLLLLAYVLLYQHARLVDLGKYPLLAWVVAFVGVDFAYYWWHRASHRVNFLWAAHVVHHQSEEYNLAVALRQGVLTPLTNLPFAMPLAFLGIPPLIWGTALALNTLYQFWIHTQLIGPLGSVESVLNTPSHHRVHHARNPGYLDRNYGAVFIVWDRLFGTFSPERERPQYGITKPLRSFNALWAQVQPLAELASLSHAAPTWREALAVWLAPPERHFSWQAPVALTERYDVRVPAALQRYVLLNFILATAATFCLMMWARRFSTPALAAGAVLILATLLSLGGLMETKRWARSLEAGRLAAVAAALVWYAAS